MLLATLVHRTLSVWLSTLIVIEPMSICLSLSVGEDDTVLPGPSLRASVESSTFQSAASLDRFATLHPATTRTFDPDDIDIPLPLNPRRHQLITNLPDTFIS